MTFKIPCRKVSLCDNYERLCTLVHKKGASGVALNFFFQDYLPKLPLFQSEWKKTHVRLLCVYTVYEILSNLQHKLFLTTLLTCMGLFAMGML